MVDQVISEWGALHIACNNAGVNLNSASKDTTLEEWDRTMNVNLRGVFLCCQAEGRAMMKQGKKCNVLENHCIIRIIV